MMFTLIAVALAGYVMIETAPDFSNYAVLAKSQQFDRNLERLRGAISSRPFYLTTADGALGDPPNDVLSTQEIRAAVSRLVLTSGTTTESSGIFLGTTPIDPYIPAKERSEVDGIFWGASYNFVLDPSFYSPNQREALDPSSLQLWYSQEDGGTGARSIVRTDRFGKDHVSIVSGANNYEHVRASTDGSRILASTDAGTGSQDVVSFEPNGAARTFATLTVAPEQEIRPEWSPSGAFVSFVRTDGVNRRLIVKSPERDSVEIDPIDEVVGGFPIVINDIGPGKFSPDGRLVAFWIEGVDTRICVYDVKLRRWVLPETDAGGAMPLGTYNGQSIPANDFTPIAWRPDSRGFLYVNTANEVVLANRVDLGVAGISTNQATGADDLTRPATELIWLPLSSPGAGVSSSTLFLALTGTDNTDGEIWSCRTDPAVVPLRLSDDVYTGYLNPPADPDLLPGYRVGVSPGGSSLAWITADQKKVMLSGVDGARPRVLFDIDQVTSNKTLEEVGFLTPPNPWQYPKANAQRVTRASRSGFDQQGWRKFTQSEALFRGDARFGEGYLRLRPPQFEDQFLFDNGFDNFRIQRANPQSPIANLRIVGKVEPTWGRQNSNFIARESADVTGGQPSDVFKQVVGGTGLDGTTVLVTTGTAPIYGPDNRTLVVSKLMSDATTYPPDTSQFPPVDTDIWIVEANGSPDPPPVNLTPFTTATAEGYPEFSPDGRFLYFQREFQQTSKFIGNHTSGIYRVTSAGGAVTQVVGEGSIPPSWNDGRYVSALEFYQPAISPCGTRLAFIARERLLGLGSLGPDVSTTRVGEVIGSVLYVKDLVFNTAPTALLRTFDREIGARMATLGSPIYLPKLNDGTPAGTGLTPTGVNAYGDHELMRPSWSPDGEEIFLTRAYPHNRWFPKKDLLRAGGVGNSLTYREMLRRTQIIRVKATHPRQDGGTYRGVQRLPDFSYDPPADNFAVVLRNVPDGPHPDGGPTFPTYVGDYDTNPGALGHDGAYDGTVAFDWDAVGLGSDPGQKHLLNPQHSRSSFAMQRVLRDDPSVVVDGISIGVDYVLSGYVRTEPGEVGRFTGQLMCQLFNNQGLLVSVTEPNKDEFQIGLADIGGVDWTRFSAGIRFDPVFRSGTSQSDVNGTSLDGWGDNPPYTMVLMTYSLGRRGAVAEFTGIKMEQAFDPNSLAPTAFAPGWLIHSSSLRVDPSRPNSLIFER